MQIRRYIVLISLLSIFFTGTSQITSFLGVHGYPTLGKTRASNTALSVGYGAGLTFVFWEHEDWFIKSGADYLSRSSKVFELPRYFEVPAGQELQRIDMRYTQNDINIPFAVYYLPYRKKGNAIIVMGGMDVMYTMQSKYDHEEYGSVVFAAEEIDQNVKIGFSLGAGYQREFSDVLFLNILPTLNLDVKSDKPFTSFGLTLEMIYGIY